MQQKKSEKQDQENFYTVIIIYIDSETNTSN